MDPCLIEVGGLPTPAPVEGGLVRVTAYLTTPAGEAVDPTTIRFLVMEPDFSESAFDDSDPEIVQEEDAEGDPVPGRYFSDVSIDSPGTWVFRWEADGDYGGATELTLSVRPSAF